MVNATYTVVIAKRNAHNVANIAQGVVIPVKVFKKIAVFLFVARNADNAIFFSATFLFSSGYILFRIEIVVLCPFPINKIKLNTFFTE